MARIRRYHPNQWNCVREKIFGRDQWRCGAGLKEGGGSFYPPNEELVVSLLSNGEVYIVGQGVRCKTSPKAHIDKKHPPVFWCESDVSRRWSNEIKKRIR